MSTHVVRLWLPDRPGALGAVASRIGAVRGDLIGIDILERGAGRAIDELVVKLPSEDLVPLLVSEMAEVDGVDIEEVRPAPESLHDPRLDALETAALVVEQRSIDDLLAVLGDHARRDFECDWVILVQGEGTEVVAAQGTPPSPCWLQAFLVGSGASAHLTHGGGGPDDVAWAEVPGVGATLVLGRDGRPFRARERRQLGALVRIAGSRWAELLATPPSNRPPSNRPGARYEKV